MYRSPAEPASYAAIAGLGRAAAAWEVLRRNPVYQADFAAWRDCDGQGDSTRAFAARWGLHFP